LTGTKKEEALVDFLKTVENPNTRTIRACALIKLRLHIHLPVTPLKKLREDFKSEAAAHRKQGAKGNMDSLVATKSYWLS
jgi:hypothetical protein